MNERLDLAVIGGGVVGLAIARRLALAGRQVVLFEAERATGQHTSSRNSEVLHGGMYYPTASYKARFCASGRRALQAYCTASKVDWRRIGKLIVAADDSELPELERIKAQGETNGVEELTFLERAQVHAIEPALTCVRALLSPGTSLVDSHGLMQALAADARAAGADIVLGSPIVGGDVTETGIELAVGGSDPGRFEFRQRDQRCGLFCARRGRKSSRLGVRPSCRARTSPRGTTSRCRGAHRSATSSIPCRVPTVLAFMWPWIWPATLRFGPDATWVEKPDYRFDESREPFFYRSIRRYYPALADGTLAPGFVGVRPKLAPAGAGFRDFQFQGPEVHGVPGLLNLFGIDSPGLTSCLAIADEVAARLE
jgi:L-2-hydroxyglutarate oxidase LhgO